MAYDYDKQKEHVKLNSQALWILKNKHKEEFYEIVKELRKNEKIK